MQCFAQCDWSDNTQSLQVLPDTTVRQVKNAVAHSFGEADTVRNTLHICLPRRCCLNLALESLACKDTLRVGECNCACVFCSGLSIMDSTCKMVQACKRQGLGKAVECMCTFVCKGVVVTEAPRGLNPDLAFWRCTAPEKLPRYIYMPEFLWSFQFKTLGSDSCGCHASCRRAASCSIFLR